MVDCDGFEDFADGILSPTLLGGTGTPPLDAFRLHLLYEGRFITFGRWVRRALTRRPASVDIHVEYGGTVDWPPALTLGDGAGTGRLKRLHLFGVHLSFISGDGGRLAELLPVLEDLRMESCTFGHEPSSPTTTIAIPTLRSLALAVVPRRTARPYALTVASPASPPCASSSRSAARARPRCASPPRRRARRSRRSSPRRSLSSRRTKS